MHPRQMIGHLAAQVALLLVAAALLALLGPGATQAGDPQDVRANLMLKCEPPEVPKVLAALAPLKVRVFDLQTMAELHAPGRPGAVTPLPDAVEAMAALYDALGGVRKDDDGFLRLSELQVTPARMIVGVELDDQSMADAIPQLIDKHAYFVGRSAEVRLGAMTRQGERWALRVEVKLGDAAGGEAPATRKVDHISALQLQRHELASNLRRMYMGAERVEPDPQRGVRTISRDITYQQGATLEQLGSFLLRLKAETDLTVIHLRWKSADGPPPHTRLGKVTLRVALRTPLVR